MGSKRCLPVKPSNAEAREAGMAWTAEEDRRLTAIARQYNYNWNLIAHVFNVNTKRIASDERLPWDCYRRFESQFMEPMKSMAPQPPQKAQQADTPTSAQVPLSALPNGVELPQSAILPNGQAMSEDAATPASASAPNSKKGRRESTNALIASVNGVLPPALIASTNAAPPGPSKVQLRRAAILEATKKTQKKREASQKASKCTHILSQEKRLTVCDRRYATCPQSQLVCTRDA